MVTLPRSTPSVHPETAAAYLANARAEDAAEAARLAQLYPVGAPLLLRNARRLVAVARDLDSGYATDRDYDRALENLDYACDEMDRLYRDHDDRTAPDPVPTATTDEEWAELPDAPDYVVTQRPGYAESLAAAGVTLAPVCGGAPATEWDLAAAFEPYVPSEADRQEWAAWLAELSEDSMAFPSKEGSAEERRRYARQNRLSEAAHAAEVE